MTKTKPLPTIAPCPCGHTRTEITKSKPTGLVSVWCKCCWIGPAEKTKRAAILAWNRRASDAEAERRGAEACVRWIEDAGLSVISKDLRRAFERGEVLPAKGKRR